MQTIFNSGEHGVAITLSGLEVTINGNIYNEPICIARLLTIQELERLESFKSDTEISKAILDQELVNLVFVSFLGITDTVDWEEIEAGVITTIADAIKAKSMQIAFDVTGYINFSQQQLGVYHSIQAIVSRFLSTPFDVVEKLPINELLRRYAICQMTFPQEVQPITNAEET